MTSSPRPIPRARSETNIALEPLLQAMACFAPLKRAKFSSSSATFWPPIYALESSVCAICSSISFLYFRYCPCKSIKFIFIYFPRFKIKNYTTKFIKFIKILVF